MGSGREVGQDLLNVPMGDMITQMAMSIAEAQLALDESGIRQAELMSGRTVLRDENGNLVKEDGTASDKPVAVESFVYFGHHRDGEENLVDERVSMMELGFTPTFYQFIDTIIEVKIEITMTETDDSSKTERGYRRSFTRFGGGRRFTARVTPVNATHSSKYSYNVEGASLLRTKLVPVPPPAVLEERARLMLELYREERDNPAD